MVEVPQSLLKGFPRDSNLAVIVNRARKRHGFSQDGAGGTEAGQDETRSAFGDAIGDRGRLVWRDECGHVAAYKPRGVRHVCHARTRSRDLNAEPPPHASKTSLRGSEATLIVREGWVTG